MKQFIIILLCNIAGISMHSQTSGSGVVAELPDNDNYYAQFGGSQGLFNERWLLIGADKIQSKQSSFFTYPKPPNILVLNKDYSRVAIGTTQALYGGLTVAAQDDQDMDIRLGGHGRMSTHQSLFVQLDHDNDADESFYVKSSDGTNLLTISENGNHSIFGTLYVDGRVRTSQLRHKRVNETEFEVINDLGDELDNEKYGAASNGGPGYSYIGASLTLPYLSRLKKITINYNDNGPLGYMDIYLKKVSHSGTTTTTLLFEGLSEDFSITGWNFSHEVNMNDMIIDYQNYKYYFYIQSNNWSGQAINFILMEYTD